MGGALALRTAAHRPDRRRAPPAAFHPARLATDAPDSPHLLADRHPGRGVRRQRRPGPGHAARAAAAARRGADRGRASTHTCEQYDGAAHGFTMSDTAVYDEAATERHWAGAAAAVPGTLQE